MAGSADIEAKQLTLKKRLMRKLLINISMLLFLAVSGQGTTYYVSTTGSDAASGLSAIAIVYKIITEHLDDFRFFTEEILKHD